MTPVVTALFVALSLHTLPSPAAPFNLVATHPDAAGQPTPTGQILATLKPFNGKLYAGYGDYDDNAGPIHVRAFDPAAGAFSPRLITQSTEAILIYREINGKLYAPTIDPWPSPPTPDQRTGYAVGTASGATETWTEAKPVVGGHVYDMATSDGNDLWMVGTTVAIGGTDGIAWRSRDGGDTWQISLVVPPQRPNATIGRLYTIHPYKNKLYTQGHDSGFGAHSTSKTFDGANWSDGPSLAGGFTGNLWHPETFAGHMVYHRSHSGVSQGRMFKFDGTQTVNLIPPGGLQSFFDYTIAGDTLYALLTDGRIVQTEDLITWATLDTAPAAGRSLGVLDNTLYVGATGGQLYRYSVPVGAIPGDADDDGVVDFEDFMALFDSFGQRGSFAHGDFNLDGTIDFLDFQILERNFGLTAAGTFDPSVTPLTGVPEPAGTFVMVMACLLAARRVRVGARYCTRA